MWTLWVHVMYFRVQGLDFGRIEDQIMSPNRNACLYQDIELLRSKLLRSASVKFDSVDV